MSIDYQRLSAYRQYLHSIAELSGKEVNTAAFIKKQLLELNPDELYDNVGGNGILAVFDSGISGAKVCFRADLDALPIEETNTFDYVSANKGISHKCGHDGHSIILLGLAQWLKANPIMWKGKVILLFQPGEETAIGAKAVLQDANFTKLAPDCIIGFHNLPGFSLGSLILRKGVFASASKGLKIKLIGKTSHAAHPENGNSPLLAMIGIIQSLCDLPHSKIGFDKAALVTIIHARLGEEAFGTSPGEAEIMATYRAHDDKTLELLTEATESITAAIATTHNLRYELQWVEEFVSTVNDDNVFDHLQSAFSDGSISMVYPESPFAWSEDFSFYCQHYPSCFFGIGAGEDHPQLHNPDYDFPDQLIKPGIEYLAKILMEISKASHQSPKRQNVTLP